MSAVPVTASNEINIAAEDSVVEHPPKRARLYSEEDGVIDNEEYEEAVQVLQDEYNNRKRTRREVITKLSKI